MTAPGLPEARPGSSGDWWDYPRALRQIVRLRRHHKAVQREIRRPHRFRDPVTGDELTLGEEISWVLQGVIRRWTVFAAITIFTIFAWIHGSIWAQGWTNIWNLFASYWAMALETVVGIAMFSQTRRDAVKIRKIERVLDTMQVLVTLVCRHLGIDGPPEIIGSDVHVDWHMTLDEWGQLQSVLAASMNVPYLNRLAAEGKLGNVAAGQPPDSEHTV